MKLGPFEFRWSSPRLETRANAEDPTIPCSAADFLAFFGIDSGNLPPVTIDSALRVPAFLNGVSFLAGCLANLPLHVFKTEGAGAKRAGGPLQRILNEAPNGEWASFALRKYFWQQVFTGGRGLLWIERAGNQVVGLWPIDPAGAYVSAVNGVRTYRVGSKSYPSSEIIDLPFFLRRDQLNHYGPIALGGHALAIAIAMGEYTGGFFQGGGVPPLSVHGPVPSGAEAQRRAYGDIQRAIDVARDSKTPIVQLPTGYELKPIGFDPAKGQMTEARLFQIQEIARVLGLPPAFLQDLSKGTFTNVEQQDINVAKHLIAHWAKALEDELNLKLFGAKRNVRYVQHALDGILRGDFLSRSNALGRAIQTGQITPNEARALEDRPPLANGDVLYIQGATVPLGSQPVLQPPKENGDEGDDDAGQQDT